MQSRVHGVSRRTLLSGAGAAGLALSFSGCSPKAATRAGAEPPKLNFYNRTSFIGQTTLADFHTASGVDVNMSLFTTNEEMYARLKGGNPGFDLIMASNEMAMRMIAERMLLPIDHGKLNNLSNLSLEFQNPSYDPGLRYTVPYSWQTLGIGYRKSRVDRTPDSWKWLLASDRYAGRIGLICTPNDLVAVSAKFLGFPANGVTDAALKQIEAMLAAQKRFVKTFEQESGQRLLFAEEADIVAQYNSDVARQMRDDSDLDFVVPKEGSVLRAACLCIPADAARPANAHAFIDFMLSPEAGAAIANTIAWATPNAAARASMDARYQKSQVLFPPDLSKCEYTLYEGEARAQGEIDLVARARNAPDTPPPPKIAARDLSKEAYVPPPTSATP